MTEAEIAAAEAEVDRARDKLIATVGELTAQLEPRKIVREVWESAKNKGANLAEDAVDAVRSRPVAIGGVAAAIGLFLARDPIKDAARRFYDGMTSAKDEPPEPKAAKTVVPPRRRTTRKPARSTAKKTTKTEKPA